MPATSFYTEVVLTYYWYNVTCITMSDFSSYTQQIVENVRDLLAGATVVCCLGLSVWNLESPDGLRVWNSYVWKTGLFGPNFSLHIVVGWHNCCLLLYSNSYHIYLPIKSVLLVSLLWFIEEPHWVSTTLKEDETQLWNWRTDVLNRK